MIGKTIGHYRIISHLGKGGMGEVYLADDTTLDRRVALKFLPEAFTNDPERMARFEREAKLLASLNHPNIAGIYGLEEAEGNRFLVLEYVEGETLQARLRKGALSLEDTLELCRQIAEGLEAAHEKGVIHRDLKPANVMITAEERVKILDFGLAKALADESQVIDPSDSPTITAAMTQPGVVLGTAAYMSPEQAKGKSVDKRADIWAFGCILYDCLTGKKAFEGETVTETLAAILRGEPDWDTLPNATPQNIRFVLSRCLEKDRSRRFRDVADVQINIEEAHDISETTVRHKRPMLWLGWGLAVAFIAAFAALSFVYFLEKTPAPVKPIRFKIALPDEASSAPDLPFVLSPDGSQLAFALVGSDNVIRIWVRALESIEARPIPGTESSQIHSIFWSPDSRMIAFDAGEKLKKIDIFKGPSQTVCDLTMTAWGGSWNCDDVIIFGTMGGEVMRVSANGGAAFPLTRLNPARQETSHCSPQFLPDGRHFLYFSESRASEYTGVYIGSLDSKPEEQGSKQLVATNFFSIYKASQNSGPGQLLFVREQTLMAQAFDDKRLELVGEAVPIAGQVGFSGNYPFFSASTNDVLVYKSGGTSQFNSRIKWFDRQGAVLGAEGELGLYYGLALSPDGTQAVASMETNPETSPVLDLHLIDFSRDTDNLFTFGQGWNVRPIWSPDGSNIIFASNRDGGIYNLYKKPVSGIRNEELLYKSSESKLPTSISSDGRFLLYTAGDLKTNKSDLWMLQLTGDLETKPFLSTEFNEADGHFSPDMRFVAYVSNESGKNEVYVRGFSSNFKEASSEMEGQWLVSHGGGFAPRWKGDGKELYYRTEDGKFMAVDVTADKAFRSGTPRPLFQPPPNSATSLPVLALSLWDITEDGERFLLPVFAVEDPPLPFNVILNWTSLLEQ